MGIAREMLMSTVLILSDLGGEKIDPPVLGTGFILAKEDTWYVITNRHVALDPRRRHESHVEMRMFTPNQKLVTGNPKRLSGMAVPTKLWATYDEGPDLAVMRFAREALVNSDGTPKLKVENTALKWEEAVQREEIEANGWWEGTPTLTMGYPGGLGWKPGERPAIWPTVRSGSVARMQEWLEGRAKDFMVDTATLGGQSGSPVFLWPHGEKPRLVGVVYGHRADSKGGDLHLQHVLPLEGLPQLLEAADRAWERQ